MMVADVAEAERLAWRCGACVVAPVLARYTALGGVYVRVAERRRIVRYVVDLHRGPIDAQCPACGAWRRLQLAQDTGITEGPRPQPWPRAD